MKSYIENVPPFVLGFLALSFQILLLREFSVHFYGNEISYGLILASWLLWGGIGSAVALKFKPSTIKIPWIYNAIILIFPLCLLVIRFSHMILGISPVEITGILPIFLFSFFISSFINFPLGLLFVFNIHYQKGNLTKVYILESMGSAVSGLIVYFLLIPTFSNWQITAIIGIFSSIVVFICFRNKKNVFLLIISVVYLLCFCIFDFPTQKLYWKPFNLVYSQDSPYGRIQIIKTKKQISLYNNSSIMYSYPNPEDSEEAVHFALLQNPQADKVLLMGGGISGGIKQILKYPEAEIDYVELDPEIIRSSMKFLPDKETKDLSNNRVHAYFKDGRDFLQHADKKYNIIILNLPEPTSTQINRFYTREFFKIARKKLKKGGIFSFRVPSAENYISKDLQNFLSSLYFTLKKEFPFIKVIPGSTNIFIASSSPVNISYDYLTERMNYLDIKNKYIIPQLLSARLDPFRIELTNSKIVNGTKKINTDLTPISYFFNSVLWSTQFKGLENKILSFFSKLPSFWILDFPLILFLIFLFLFLFKKRNSFYYLIPLAILGFTSIIVEIFIIIIFQSYHGYLYEKIALLLTSFMSGLF
ncbi:MAG: spermidine synthase, partial [Candidatus Aminicenantaceae bacterium]